MVFIIAQVIILKTKRIRFMYTCITSFIFFILRDLLKPELIQAVLSHDIHMIECGESHVVMLTRDWKIFVWGSGDCGRLGIGSGDDWLVGLYSMLLYCMYMSTYCICL